MEQHPPDDGALDTGALSVDPTDAASQNDPSRAAVRDTVYSGVGRPGDTLSNHPAPARVFSLMEQHPPDDVSLDTGAQSVDPPDAAWQND
jgi:hypothetical protein